MRIGVVALLLALPVSAVAQPGMTSPASGGDPYGPPEPYVAPAPKVNFDIGLVAASPKGDWNRPDGGIGVATSPGFHLSLGFLVSPNLSVFGGLRFIRVELDTAAQDSFGDLEMTHRELQLGLRYVSAMSGSTRFFLEGNVHSANVSVDSGGESDSTSGTGLGIRGGLIFAVDRKIGIGGAVGYSSSKFSENDDSFDDAWLTGDVFLSFGF